MSKTTEKPISSQVSEASRSALHKPTWETLSMFGQGDFPAKTSQLPGIVRGWLEADQVSISSSIDLLRGFARTGLSSKMCPVYSAPIQGKTLQLSLRGLPESFVEFLTEAGKTPGLQKDDEDFTTSLGASWTLSISESPNAAVASSLSDILEVDAPPKYFLSSRAAKGILSRASRRGKELPPQLAQALQAVAMEEVTQPLDISSSTECTVSVIMPKTTKRES